MRRSLLRLAVAVIMLLMVLAMAAPAFAAVWNSESGCRGEDLLIRDAQTDLRIDHNHDGYLCVKNTTEPGPSGYDNRTDPGLSM